MLSGMQKESENILIGSVTSIPVGDNVLRITKEDDKRWTIIYKIDFTKWITRSSKNYKEALREVYRYAKSNKASKEELRTIEDIANSKLFEEWTVKQ